MNQKPEILLAPLLFAGDFVRVRKDHPDHSRAGKSALVLNIVEEDVVVTFRYDDSKAGMLTVDCGAENWDIAELDLETVDRKTRIAHGLARMQ